jgi:hypothetical protein
MVPAPTASDVPKKERRLTERFDDLGFDVDVVNNDAEDVFIGFIPWSRTDAEYWSGNLSYLFNLQIIERFRRRAQPDVATTRWITPSFETEKFD